MCNIILCARLTSLFIVRHNQNRIRIKGTGIKAKASPETEPDFYSMPFLKPEHASIEEDRDIEYEVSVALQDENKRACQESSKKVKKVECDDAFIDHRSPGHSFMGMGIPTVVTPDSRRAKKMLSVPSLLFESSPVTTKTKFNLQPSQTWHEQGNGCQFPPLLSSDLEEPHPGDEITFEGEHFHYLDSFVDHNPPQFISLAPRNESDVMIHQNHGVVPHRPFPSSLSTLTTQPSQDAMMSTPLIECDNPTIAYSLAQSLREPIMSPYSSSSSSLDEIFQQGGSLQVDADTIFTDDFGGDWGVGRDVGMDAYFP